LQLPDITSRADLEYLLQQFYQKAFADPLIGFFFTEVVPLDLETHIPRIADFWESVIFNTRGYRKNVMEVHQHISDLSPIKKEHLDQWVKIFTATVDQYFEGDKASLIKNRAISIATLMKIKISYDHPGSPAKS
jgi:hemoglobin